MNYHAAKSYILNRLKNELSDKLAYHGVHHTIDVLAVVDELCDAENISQYNRMLLKTAALFHDSGFIYTQKGHEEKSCEIASENLPRYGYTTKEIETIRGMIMATQIPQSPTNKLEEIMCDADLDYLGRPDFYDIGRTLYEELKSHSIIESEEQWNNIQIGFLESHAFFTETNKNRRSPKKRFYLQQLKELMS